MAKATKNQRTDKHVRQILEILREEYGANHPRARIQVYRYNPACVRARVMDPDFAHQPMRKREEMLFKIVQKLADKTWTQLSMLLPITPEEHEDSWLSGASRRFDEPNSHDD